MSHMTTRENTIPDSSDHRGVEEENNLKEIEKRLRKKKAARYQCAAGWGAQGSQKCKHSTHRRASSAVDLQSASPRWYAVATASSADAWKPVYARARAAPQRRRTLRRLTRRGPYEWRTRVLAPWVARLSWLVGVAVCR